MLLRRFPRPSRSMYFGDVSETNGEAPGRQGLPDRPHGPGTRQLVTYISHCLRPNLVRLSHLSCSDHFCFYYRFGLVTFRDCTNWGPLLQKCLKKKLLTRKENQDQCEHWLLENEEYSDEKETKKYSIYYFEKLTNMIFHCGGGSSWGADYLTQFWGGRG